MRRRDLLRLIGAAVALEPLAGAAQQPKMPVVGFLGAGDPGPFAPVITGFRQGLGEFGYIEGQNLSIEYRWAEGDYDRLPGLVGDLVARKVALIATIGGIATQAAKEGTSTIPIVFGIGTDPVATGLVASLARPGGNLTGMTVLYTEMLPKRFELLAALVPQARVIGLLVNPTNPNTGRTIADAQEAARAYGVQLIILKAGNESEIDAVFAALAGSQVGALIIGSDALFNSHREKLGALALRHAVPAIYEIPQFAAAGGLVSYAPSLSALHRQSGIYAGKILQGATPADLPVQAPTKFELVINLKTAKALGLTVPQSLLARADEVIE